MASPSAAALCFCDECGPSGAPQTRSTRAHHQKAQSSRSRLGVPNPSTGYPKHEAVDVIDFDPPTVLETLSQDEWTYETPLWRGRSVPVTCSTSNRIPANTSREHTPESELLLSQVRERTSRFAVPDKLKFKFPPTTPTAMYPGPETNGSWEDGPSALRDGDRDNAVVLIHVSYLRSIQNALEYDSDQNQGGISGHHALRMAVTAQLTSLERWRLQQWARTQRSTPDPGDLRGAQYNTDSFFEALKNDNPIVNSCVILVVILNLLYHLTLPACRLTVKLLKRMVVLLYQQFTGNSEPSEEVGRLIHSIPADVSTAVKRLNLMPDEIVYACCPECFALYPPSCPLTAADLHQERIFCQQERYQSTSDALPYFAKAADVDTLDAEQVPESREPSYPMFCTHEETTTSGECGAKLLRMVQPKHLRTTGEGMSKRSPAHQWRAIRTYSYQPITSWIARMMSRPDFEQMVDTSLRRSVSDLPGDYIDDILQSSEIRNFLGYDGQQYLRPHQSESRLLFSFFIDWFSTRGNHRAGAQVSSGVIFLACLNLPPEVRYKRENIYLAGVIPGPKSPSLQQVNHFISPLIPELLTLWKDGVFLTRTAVHPTGRVVKAALVILVSDLGAVRKTSGTASHSAAHFCSFCQLLKQNINNTQSKDWPRRDCDKFRELARRWKQAPDEAERKRLFKQNGIRYSVLLELPYWKPTRFVVLDTMHNMFLGLFQRHCRKVFGMNIQVDDGEDDGEKVVSAEDLAKAVQKLQRAAAPESLRDALNVPTIRALYEAAGLGSPGKKTKLEMARGLLGQVSVILREMATTLLNSDQRNVAIQQATAPGRPQPVARPKKKVILDKTILQEVRSDISLTVLPTYIGRTPPNVGSASAGTLSADQWRTFCTIHLVITLARLWGDLPLADRRREMLGNYLNLVAVVRYGTARRTSANRIRIYNTLISNYVDGLRRLFPENDLVPNQHLAMHLGEVLANFGPTHSYWAFPFERYIRLMRQAKINFRNSETERTFFRSFCIANNLKSLLVSRRLPALLQDFAELIDCAFAGDTSLNNQHLPSIFGMDSEPELLVDERKTERLRVQVYHALLARILGDPTLHRNFNHCSVYDAQHRTMALNPMAQVLSTIQHRGRRYTTFQYFPGDSHVVFRWSLPGRTSGELALGRIFMIFLHKRTLEDGQYFHQAFAALSQFTALSERDAVHDPYRMYQPLRTTLVYSAVDPNVVVVPLRDIVSHFVACPYRDDENKLSRPCMVAIPLDEM